MSLPRPGSAAPASVVGSPRSGISSCGDMALFPGHSAASSPCCHPPGPRTHVGTSLPRPESSTVSSDGDAKALQGRRRAPGRGRTTHTLSTAELHFASLQKTPRVPKCLLVLEPRTHAQTTPALNFSDPVGPTASTSKRFPSKRGQELHGRHADSVWTHRR